VGAAECAAFRADDQPPSPLRRDLPRSTLDMLAAALKPRRVQRRRGSGMGEMGASANRAGRFLTETEENGEIGWFRLPVSRLPLRRSLLLCPNLCQFLFFVAFGFFSPPPPAVTPSSLVSVLTASLAIKGMPQINYRRLIIATCFSLFYCILPLGPFGSLK
jgi:hypothetical protein